MHNVSQALFSLHKLLKIQSSNYENNYAHRADVYLDQFFCEQRYRSLDREDYGSV